MALPKHLPLTEWPDPDRRAFAAAYLSGDIFDETAGPGAHLSAGSRKIIEIAYRRWLGFLREAYPSDLDRQPAARITIERIRAFVSRLEKEVRPTTTAHVIGSLFHAARLIDGEGDWGWLRAIGARLAALGLPLNRFNHLVPGVRTLDFGFELMDTALQAPLGMVRSTQFRDGLIIALLSLWPIRRRSLAALTIDRHLVFDGDGLSITLGAEDTKERRPESCRVTPELVPYVKRYLDEMRPGLFGGISHNGLWASCKGRPMTGGAIYRMVRIRMQAKYGKDVCLHDFRRAAATFTAIDAPENLGLIPGLLQHTSPEVSEQHYNLAGSVKAIDRYNATIAELKAALSSDAKTSKR